MAKLKLVAKDGFILAEDIPLTQTLLDQLPRYVYFRVGKRCCYLDSKNR